MAKMTPIKVMEKWDALEQKERNSKIAKALAKSVGMRSIGEVRCAADMDQRGIIYKYEPEILIYQHKPQKYTPDFVLEDGTILEYKGKMTNETKKKLLSIRRCNPDRTMHLIFERPQNKLNRGSKTTYGGWAEKNGFNWAEHYVDEAWLGTD